MESDPDSTTVEERRLTTSCDCAAHAELESLIAELDDARAEVRKLKMIVPAGRERTAREWPTRPRGWRALLGYRQALWWALADSE